MIYVAKKDMIYVVKRDGRIMPFNLEKIKTAILKAF